MNKRALYIAIIVGIILLIPLTGNIFVGGWDWNIFDFCIAGILLFSTGLALDFAWRNMKKPLPRVAAVVGILGILFFVWVELAVGAISRAVHFFITQFI